MEKLVNPQKLSLRLTVNELINFYEENKNVFFNTIDIDKKNNNIQKLNPIDFESSKLKHIDLICNNTIQIIYKAKYRNRPPTHTNYSIKNLIEQFRVDLYRTSIYYMNNEKQIIDFKAQTNNQNTNSVKESNNKNSHEAENYIIKYLNFLDSIFNTNLKNDFNNVKKYIFEPLIFTEIYYYKKNTNNGNVSRNSKNITKKSVIKHKTSITHTNGSESNSSNSNSSTNINDEKKHLPINFTDFKNTLYADINDADINEKISNLLYKLSFVNQHYHSINNYFQYLFVYNAEEDNLNPIRDSIEVVQAPAPIRYFDFEKKKLIHIYDIVKNESNSRMHISIGKSFEIIDFDNKNDFSYSFTYIHNKYYVTDEPNYNKSLKEYHNKYYNKYLQINDFLLYSDMLEMAKHTSHMNNLKRKFRIVKKTDDDINFKKTMTNMPNFILNVLLNNQPFCKIINKDEIFNSQSLEKDISPLYIKNRSNPMREAEIFEYEKKFTISVGTKNNSTKRLYDKQILYNNLEEFFESKCSIFIGYIHLDQKEGFIKSALLRDIAGHENLFIIDKKKKILIKYEPRGFGYDMFNFFETIDLKDYFFKLLEEYDKHETCNFKNFVYSINGYLTNKENNYTYIDTSTIDTINYPYPNSKKSKDYHFPQYHDKKKGSFKPDTNCQSYVLCASLLYCMNPNFTGISKYIGLANDVKKYYDFIILLTKYGITKERVKFFREYLNAHILPMIIGDEQDDTEDQMRGNMLYTGENNEHHNNHRKNSLKNSNPNPNSNNGFVLLNTPAKPITHKQKQENSNPNSNSNNDFVLVNTNKQKTKTTAKKPKNKTLVNSNSKSNSNNDFVLI